MKLRFTLRRLMLFIAVIAIYLGTGVGGYRAHLRQLQREAQMIYDRQLRDNEFEIAFAEKTGGTPSITRLLPGGPRCHVDYCIPIVPGVCFVQSGWGVHSLCAREGTKIVIFYGTGSFTLMELMTAVA